MEAREKGVQHGEFACQSKWEFQKFILSQLLIIVFKIGRVVGGDDGANRYGLWMKAELKLQTLEAMKFF